MLVEDVIRHINNKYKNGLNEEIKTLKGLSKLENDDGNLYINVTLIPRFFSLFLEPDQTELIESFGNFAHSTYLDITITDREILMNGSSLTAGGNNQNFVHVFKRQNAGEIDIAQYLPHQTALFYDVTFYMRPTPKMSSAGYKDGNSKISKNYENCPHFWQPSAQTALLADFYFPND